MASFKKNLYCIVVGTTKVNSSNRNCLSPAKDLYRVKIKKVLLSTATRNLKIPIFYPALEGQKSTIQNEKRNICRQKVGSPEEYN